MSTHAIYAVLHKPSGKVFLGITGRAFDSILKEIVDKLRKGEYGNTVLQGLYDKDPDIDIQFQRRQTERQANIDWLKKAREYHNQGVLLNYRAGKSTLHVVGRPKRVVLSAGAVRGL